MNVSQSSRLRLCQKPQGNKQTHFQEI